MSMAISSNRYLPLVSIVVINWNGEKYIHACAKPIAMQTYRNIEVIVIDNGSTDLP